MTGLGQALKQLFQPRKWTCRFCGRKYPINEFNGAEHLANCEGLRKWKQHLHGSGK